MSRPRSAPVMTPRPWAARLASWLLALCLVLSPALGRVHQVVHGGPLGTAVPAAPQAHGATAQAANHGHAHGSGMLEALFHGHAGSDCNLLDQLLFGMALLPVPVLAVLPGAEPAPHTPPATGIGARPQRAFLARAPPGSGRA